LTKDPAEQDAAEKAVAANAKQIANTFAPFYGEARAEELFTLLSGHYAAVKAYSEATISGNKGQVNAALAHFESNTDDIDIFFNGVNPAYLPKGTVRPLIAVHVSHHQPVQQKELCKARCNLADDATTCLSHCRYAHEGIGKTVSREILLIGERRRAASSDLSTHCGSRIPPRNFADAILMAAV
jgi:hypothetical protein